MKTKFLSLLTVLTVLLIGSLKSNYSFSQVTTPVAPFITLWNTNLGGVNDAYYIEFVSNGSYKVEIKNIDSTTYKPVGIYFGDYVPQLINLTYFNETIGIYYLKITPFDTASYTGPAFNYFSVNTPYNLNNPTKLIQVVQWGDALWNSFDNSFEGASNLLVTATDNPNLGDVSDMSYAFAGTNNINQNISNWDMSSVTNTTGMFAGVTNFNQDIGGWDVSNVTVMDSMFAGANNFDQDLGNWDVSNVTSMAYLFSGSSSMNGLATKGNSASKSTGIGGWDVSKVVNMEGMFQNAMSFNQGVGGWDVSKVVNMKNMFAGATSYNQDIGGWDVSKVVNMEGMFSGANKFNQAIGGWDVSKVVNMGAMFQNAAKFNQGIGGWDVSKVKYMENIFQNASKFNQNIGGWDVSKVGQIAGAENDFSFDFSGMDCANYGATLKGWSQSTTTPNFVNISAIGMIYPTVDAPFRADLINLKNWTIFGDNESSTCSPLAVSTIENGNTYAIYPNPTINEVTISGLEGVETIDFIDLTGRVVLSNQVTNTLVTINLENLSKGIYTVVIRDGNGSKIADKIIKE